MAKAKVVIGIDFGTTFSGFSFAVASRKTSADDVFTNCDWPDDDIFVKYPKTSTSLFYRSSDDANPLWGWPARKASIETSRQEPWQHQHRFKLHLANNHLNQALPPLPPGKTAEDVIADFLRLMSKYAIDQIRKRAVVDQLQVKDVQWCITVPATYDQAARVTMEQIAMRAGLVLDPALDNGASPHPIVIVLEPEAASVWCLRHFAQSGGDVSQSIESGLPYLVVDAGGGTVDLVVHKKEGDALREVHPGTGGLCGATFVDDAFLAVIRAKFPELDRWKVEKPLLYFRMLLNWELGKRVFSGKETNVVVPLPKPIKGLFLKEGEDETFFSLVDMKALFDPVIFQICELIDAQLRTMPEICSIFLVGGFALSPYLEDRLKAAFEGVRTVHRVPVAAEAVVNGAVLLGLNAAVLSTRCMRKTYGLAAADSPLPSDPPQDVRVVNGHRLCISRFDIFVAQGEEISFDHVVTKQYRPDRLDVDLHITLYSASIPNPKNIRQPEVQQVALLAIPLSTLAGFGIDGVIIKLYFGKTVMELIVSDVRTGKTLDPLKLAFEERE